MHDARVWFGRRQSRWVARPSDKTVSWWALWRLVHHQVNRLDRPVGVHWLAHVLINSTPILVKYRISSDGTLVFACCAPTGRCCNCKRVLYSLLIISVGSRRRGNTREEPRRSPHVWLVFITSSRSTWVGTAACMFCFLNVQENTILSTFWILFLIRGISFTIQSVLEAGGHSIRKFWAFGDSIRKLCFLNDLPGSLAPFFYFRY